MNYNIYNAQRIYNLDALVYLPTCIQSDLQTSDGNRLAHVQYYNDTLGAVQVFCDRIRLFFIRHCGRTILGKDLRKLVCE